MGTLDSMKWKNGVLSLLDQRQLPNEVIWRDYTNYRDVVEAIRTLTVRGAPAIGITAGYAYVLAAYEYRNDEKNFMSSMRIAKDRLASSRPTAVNLFWALDRMEKCLVKNGSSPAAIPALEKEAIRIHTENTALCAKISSNGADILTEDVSVLTHCNAGPIACSGLGTALGVILEGFRRGKVKNVYVDETRPLLQGSRLTAWELTEAGVPTILQCDNMAGSLMQQGKIDCVIVGCDRMAANGDFANKIGTYSLAVLARFHHIPFYTALPFSSVDFSIADGSHITVEQRNGDEIKNFAGVQTAPANVMTYNPAFDVTPNKLITGIITEKGVIMPPYQKNLKKLDCTE